MRSQRYYQYIEKDAHVVDKKWRVLHIIFFLAIFFSSVIGAEEFCDIFDIFNYRCILYAKASTKFLDIIYKNQSDRLGNNTLENSNETDLNYFRLNLGVEEQDYEIEMFSSGRKFDINMAEKVPGTKDIYMLDEELWIDNETVTGRAHVGMTTTIFESVFLCDLVVFVPLMSAITSTFFGLLVALFSRSGRRSLESIPPAFLYVYPLVIVASVMTVMSIIACNLLFSGLDVFCAHFAHLTGHVKCSPLMDYFTKEQRRGYRHLYSHMSVCRIAYPAAALFWIGQLAVGLLRLLSAADYVLTTVLIKSKIKFHDEDAEDIFLMRWDKAPVPQLAVVVDTLKREYKEV